MSSYKKKFAFAVLMFAGGFAAAQNIAPAASQPADEQAKIAAALDETKKNQDAAALDLFAQVLAKDPNNAQINLLAAGAAIEAMQPALALKYAEQAQHLASSDWTVHLSLLVADAGTGRLKERDQERQILRGFHTDGLHPDAAKSNGFMVEYFPVKEYRVRAVEYFEPVTPAHFSYRFLVDDQERSELWTIALESDDIDQASWAAAHKDLAASGGREYSLDGYGTGTHITYRNFSGKPSYDDVKSEVVKLLSSPSTAPALAEKK